MKSIQKYEIVSNENIAIDIYKMVLKGDSSWVKRPGQFVNITIENAYLKRPISICDWDENGITIIYKVVGFGTKQLSNRKVGDAVECLVDLGNGYDIDSIHEPVLVVGGGVGVPPIYGLAKSLVKKGVEVTALLAFNSKENVFYLKEFEDLGIKVHVCTMDGTVGTKGFASDVMKQENLCDLFYMVCGNMPMMQSVYKTSNRNGMLSFEERMGCGFGACMGCSCKTLTGYKRICKEGPVMKSEEILWTKD